MQDDVFICVHLCFCSVPHAGGRLDKGVQGGRFRVDPPLQEGNVLSFTPISANYHHQSYSDVCST